MLFLRTLCLNEYLFIPLQHLYLSPDEWHFNHVYWNHAAISLPIFTCQEMFTFHIHLVYPVGKPNCKRSFSNISGMMIFCILLWLNLNLCWKAIYFSMDLMTCTSCVCGHNWEDTFYLLLLRIPYILHYYSQHSTTCSFLKLHDGNLYFHLLFLQSSTS